MLAILYEATAITLWIVSGNANVSSYPIYKSFFTFSPTPVLAPEVLFNISLRFIHPIGAALAGLFYFVIVFRGVDRISTSILNRAIEYGFWWIAFFFLLFFQALTILVLNVARLFDLLLLSAFIIGAITLFYMIIMDQVAKWHGASFVAWIMWLLGTVVTFGFVGILASYFFNAEKVLPSWISALTWIFIIWLLLAYCLYMLFYMLQVGYLKDFRVHLWVLTSLVFVWSMIFYWVLFAMQ